MNSRAFGILLGGWLLVGCGDDESTPRPDTTQAADSHSRASPPATCVGGTGPLSTLDTPRQTLPWSLDPSAVVPQDGGTGDPPDADAGGDGSAPTSACQKTIQRGLVTSITCEGTAAVEAGEGGPTLTFGDGSRLIWDSSRIQTRVPLELELDETSVWVSYSESQTVVCPYCGTYSAQAITVREREDGKQLVVAQQGHRLDDLNGSALVLELFGVDSVARPRCSYSVTAYCYTYDRTEFDHALLTDPEQIIRSATLTRVSSENGDYDVLWAHSEENNLRREPPLCSDGPIDASNTGFLAIRR
jgi:hypothetical protein